MTKKPEFRRKLWERDPHCHWCGIETLWISPTGNGEEGRRAATIDHLFHRLHPERTHANKGKVVLACHACNQGRNIAFMKEVRPSHGLPREPQRNIARATTEQRIRDTFKKGGWYW